MKSLSKPQKKTSETVAKPVAAKRVLSIRFPEKLYVDLKGMAEGTYQTVNGLLVEIARDRVEAWKEEKQLRARPNRRIISGNDFEEDEE